jgi:hypothetical protein
MEMRRKILQLTMVFVLGLGVNAFGADIVWEGDVSNRWDVGDNWDQTAVPGSSDTAYIGHSSGTDTVLIDSSTAASCYSLRLSYQSSNSTTYKLNMTGGSLNVAGSGSSGRFSLGETNSGQGEFNLSGGAVTVNDRLMLGDHGHGVMNMSGGTLDTSVGINMGCRGSTSGALYLSAGTITAPSIWCGDDSTATAALNMTGGAINLSSTLYVNTFSNGTLGGMMSLDGGVVTASALSMDNGDNVAGTLDITGGKLVLDGEYDSSWAYYDDGWVTAYGGTGSLVFTYDGEVTEITAIPEPATMGLLTAGFGLALLRRRRR